MVLSHNKPGWFLVPCCVINFFICTSRKPTSLSCGNQSSFFNRHILSKIMNDGVCRQSQKSARILLQFGCPFGSREPVQEQNVDFEQGAIKEIPDYSELSLLSPRMGVRNLELCGTITHRCRSCHSGHTQGNHEARHPGIPAG